jgi:hypothetical protein
VLIAIAALISPYAALRSDSGTSAAPVVAEQQQDANQEVRRIAGLSGPSQLQALQALLANFPDDPDFLGRIFYFENRLRPSLRALIGDAKVGELALNLLALVGVSQDLGLIVRSLPAFRAESSDNRWVYGLVCALVEPSSEMQWQFLRSAALNEYDDRWVEGGAIQTLKLIASDRSRRILEEMRGRDSDRESTLARALKYIESKPAPLLDRKLDRLAYRVAQAVKIGNWEGNSRPRYNQAGDKALVDAVFLAGRDRLTYTATFHRDHSVWRFKGVRETLQQLMPLPPPPPPKPR